MTFEFEDCTITTWGLVDGQQLWRVRWGVDPDFAEFAAPRHAEQSDLRRAATEAMRVARGIAEPVPFAGQWTTWLTTQALSECPQCSALIPDHLDSRLNHERYHKPQEDGTVAIAADDFAWLLAEARYAQTCHSTAYSDLDRVARIADATQVRTTRPLA